MSFCLCVYFTSIIHFSSFKSVTILILIVILFDLVKLFLSLAINQNGTFSESIMDGAIKTLYVDKWSSFEFTNTNENFGHFPFVITLPSITPERILCNSIRYSGISVNLADIIIPGLAINHARMYDVAASNSFDIYFVFGLVSYGLGLFASFITLLGIETTTKVYTSLFFTGPCIIAACLGLAIFREDLDRFWSGHMIKKYVDLNIGVSMEETNQKYKTRKMTFKEAVKSMMSRTAK